MICGGRSLTASASPSWRKKSYDSMCGATKDCSFAGTAASIVHRLGGQKRNNEDEVRHNRRQANKPASGTRQAKGRRKRQRAARRRGKVAVGRHGGLWGQGKGCFGETCGRAVAFVVSQPLIRRGVGGHVTAVPDVVAAANFVILAAARQASFPRLVQFVAVLLLVSKGFPSAPAITVPSFSTD